MTQPLQTLGSACWMAKTACTLLGTTSQHHMMMYTDCWFLFLVPAWNMHCHIVKLLQLEECHHGLRVSEDSRNGFVWKWSVVLPLILSC